MLESGACFDKGRSVARPKHEIGDQKAFWGKPWLELGNELGIKGNGPEDILRALSVNVVDHDVEMVPAFGSPCIGIGLDHPDPGCCGAEVLRSLLQRTRIQVQRCDFQFREKMQQLSEDCGAAESEQQQRTRGMGPQETGGRDGVPSVAGEEAGGVPGAHDGATHFPVAASGSGNGHVWKSRGD